MNEEFNAKCVKLSEQTTFHCTCCGNCCRNLEEAVMLENLDAFRLLHFLKEKGSSIDSMDELYARYTSPVPLDESGYPIYVLNTKGPQHECVFLENGRCSVYEARPRTCRLYPFSVGPGEMGKTFQYYVCCEKPHHFTGGTVRVHEWMHQNFDMEAQAFTKEEFANAIILGQMIRRLGNAHQHRRLFLFFQYRYWNFDIKKPFMPQYRSNHARLVQELQKLCNEK